MEYPSYKCTLPCSTTTSVPRMVPKMHLHGKNYFSHFDSAQKLATKPFLSHLDLCTTFPFMVETGKFGMAEYGMTSASSTDSARQPGKYFMLERAIGTTYLSLSSRGKMWGVFN